MSSINQIQICWKGPFTIEEVLKLNGSKDVGVYQIYGTHEIMGNNTLLYIGKTEQCFFVRFSQHWHTWIQYEQDQVKIYVGYLHQSKDVEADIKAAESLLIYYCSPPYNSSDISGNQLENGEIPRETIVLNLWRKAKLPNEVSTLWYYAEGWNAEGMGPALKR